MMKYSLVIILLFGILLRTMGQVVDSSLIVPPETKEIIEIINDKKSSEDLQNNTNYIQSDFTQGQNIKNKEDQLLIHELKLEMKKGKMEEFKTKAIIIDDNREQTGTKVIVIDSVETDIKKRLIVGPSQFDSRIELRYLSPLVKWQQQVLNNAHSVGIIIEKDMIHQVTDSIYQLDISSTLGSLYNLCPGEAFCDQPVVGVGTAFIIEEQTMITAAHVFTRPIENYIVVFGFEMVNKVGAYEAFISLKDIYYPCYLNYNSDDLDVSTFGVERPIDKPALKWCNSLSIPDNSSVYMIGHPMGLPKKVALNASIKGNENLSFFYTSLDAFQGNSGSPVFRFDTHEVIGILVSGELDYRWNGNCNASTLCGIPYCKGEKVIRIEEIMNELNRK